MKDPKELGRPMEQWIREDFAEIQQKVVNTFLKALKEYDGDAIIELAKAVWFLKDKFGERGVVADRERTDLLVLKCELERENKTMTIRQIAERIYGKKAFSQDGFSALRRKCKAMRLPITASRKTRPKRRSKSLKR